MKTIFVFYCLLCATWTKGASIRAEGFERGEVSFQCSHRYADTNRKYLCKHVCNGGADILATVGSGKSVKSGRIILVDFGNGVFNVTFSQLRLSDSGRYWCGVVRTGFDTFTEVHLTVKEAEINVITTFKPNFSPTWTYQDTTNSTQLTPVTNLSTASNPTNGRELNISTGSGAVLCAAIGTVVMLTTLVLVMCFRKRASMCFRKNSKPQPQVCSSNSADESEADCDYVNIGEELQSIEKLPERFSCTHHHKQDPLTSASTAADCSVPLRIYENICFSKSTADPRYSAVNVQDKHDIGSGIYITPLPSVGPESGDGSLGKYTIKPTADKKATRKPVENPTSNASACYSRSGCDSRDVRPRSLWFGLDLSGRV